MRRVVGNGILLALLATVVVAPSAAVGDGGCITKLPITASLKSSSPSDYDDFVPLDVSTKGPVLRRVKVGLYSFHGRVMAERRVGSIESERSLAMRIRNKVSTGTYTLYAEGEPNPGRSCGPKHWSRVVRIGKHKSTKKKKSDSSDSSGSSDGSESTGSGANPDDSIPPDQRL